METVCCFCLSHPSVACECVRCLVMVTDVGISVQHLCNQPCRHDNGAYRICHIDPRFWDRGSQIAAGELLSASRPKTRLNADGSHWRRRCNSACGHKRVTHTSAAAMWHSCYGDITQPHTGSDTFCVFGWASTIQRSKVEASRSTRVYMSYMFLFFPQ